ncbi:ATP synthase F(0) complex subunit g, mitochondrial-like [Ciona intestinalis]
MSKLIGKIPIWTKAGIAYSTPKLKNFWKFAKVELRPPTPAEVGQSVGIASKSIANISSGKVMGLSVKQAWQNTLVFTEVCMWFFIGEIIGRKSLIGYKV